MVMKITRIFLLLVFILLISTGCFSRSEDKIPDESKIIDEDFLSYEEVVDIYNNNKKMINSIKDGLLSSGFIPDKQKDISLYYENDQVICSNDTDGEKLKIIQNIYDDVFEFLSINEDIVPDICFREVRGKIIIEFEFRSKNLINDYRAGIVYTTTPKEPWGEVHIEDNWYAYKYVMD